ncbi:hypothetical protein [Persicobacter sp. CCB-QB2]|uniref:hypothetical protein n=1 Tax=Persicobacter sp. CCB-QB2 TaxID=1561025 RepID=UPI0006A96517|nr:hypothetical protein [Persicobacter sp. CCB-QB2]
MDLLKISTDWAKAELVSTSFFIIAGLVFVMCSFGFWQFGKTDLAKAYIIPILVAGAFLMTVGFGLFFTNKGRITQFETAYNEDVSAFVASEMARTESTLKEYKTVVFTAIPFIIMACGLAIFLVNTPGWRAGMISTIAMLSVILLIDGLAYARIADYQQELIKVEQELK